MMGDIIQGYLQLGLLGMIGVTFIWMLVSNHRALTSHVQALREQQVVLDNIFNALKPTTLVQAKGLIELTIDYNRLICLNDLISIIKHNNINDPAKKEMILNELNTKFSSTYARSINLLRQFNYSGKSLDKYLPEWWQNAVKVALDELYSQGGKDIDRTTININSLFDYMKNNANLNLING